LSGPSVGDETHDRLCAIERVPLTFPMMREAREEPPEGRFFDSDRPMQMLVDRVELDMFTISNLPTDVGFYRYEVALDGDVFRLTELVRIVDGVEQQVLQEPERKWAEMAIKKQMISGSASYPATIYPAPTVTAPGADWVGTDETGYTSAALKARIMPVGDGKWWAQVDGEWLGGYDGITEYPTASKAREQVERRRESERG
jgi:hypothetical protein